LSHVPQLQILPSVHWGIPTELNISAQGCVNCGFARGQSLMSVLIFTPLRSAVTFSDLQGHIFIGNLSNAIFVHL